jgi:hypothetical protein
MKCQRCDEEADELVRIKVGKKTLKLCESCADDAQREQEVSEGAESAMQGMMEYKGR